ncbi:Uncharacterised protein [Klebsiella pneumoniae]|nr:Uncharacterised protein [Klebsiella pneumoniae]
MLDLSQETYSFTEAIQQGEMRFRAYDSQRDPRQTRPGTHIDKTRSFKVWRNNNAIENVAYQHLIRIANRGQVIGLIPLIQHAYIGDQLIFLVIGK